MTARPEVVEAVAEAVRLVEDAIDATSEPMGTYGDVMAPTARTGLAVVEALVEAGWAPPAPTTVRRCYCAPHPCSCEHVDGNEYPAESAP